MGLNLAKRRIALLNQIYERKYTLNVSENEEGTKVDLSIEG